jgi:hypothetical protein
MIAIGPYQRTIPFVNIQEIKIDLDSEKNIFVLISISNEVIHPNGEKHFSNYLYLTSNKAEIDALASDPDQLIKQIKQDDSANRMNFSLSREDFKLKSSINGPNESQIYNNVYTVRRNLQPGAQNIYALVVSYKQTSLHHIIGNIVKETILFNGMSRTNANLYTLAKSFEHFGERHSIWPGTAHLKGGEIMAGNTHASTPHPILTQKIILNTKIKDFRVLKAAASLSFTPTVTPITGETYLSPIELSRNKEGNVHGFFSLDHLSFAIANTNFGRLIKNNAVLLSSTQIKDVVIYQKIVKKGTSGNKLTPNHLIGGPIDQINQFKRVASLNDGLQIISTFNQNNILNMSFIDQTTKNYSGNMLEYKVKIIFQDRTREAISLAADRLSASIKNYDSGKPTASPQVSKSLIDTYITSLGFVYGAEPFAIISFTAWQLYLMSMLADVGADADSNKGRVLKIMRNLALKLAGIVNPTTNITSGGPKIKSKIYNSSMTDAPRLEKIFAHKYQITNYRSIGLNYLDSIIQNAGSAAPVVSYAAMLNRAAGEVGKYSVNNPNLTSINQVGFLTPQSVGLRANSVVVPSDTLINSTALFSSLIRSHAEGSPVVNLETAKSVETNTLEILSQHGVSITQNNNSLRKFVFDEKIVAPEAIDSQNYLSSGSNFATADDPASSISGSSNSIVVSPSPGFRPATSALAVELLNQSVTEFNNITRITNPSSISGSLALQKSKEDFSLIENSDTMTNILNFGSIAQVQYLAGYDPTAGIQSPIWALLDQNMYNMIVSENKPLICRLVKISNTLDVPESLNLQPLASLFTLGTAQSIASFATLNQIYLNTLNNMSQQNANMIQFLTMTDGLYAQNIPFAAQTQNIPSAAQTRQITSPGEGY